MTRYLLALLFFGITAITNAQKQPVIIPFVPPIDSITKLITYEKVVDVKGSTANILYNRINDWFHSYYKNPTEVIRENDSIKFRIVGKPRFRMSNPADKSGTKTDGGTVQYTITVAMKDNRFKYELTEFNWKQLSYYPSEKWMDTKSASYLPVYNDYLIQLDKTANEVINAVIQAATHDKSTKDKDAW